MYRKEVQLLVGLVMAVEVLLVPLACAMARGSLAYFGVANDIPGDVPTLVHILFVVAINNIAILKTGLYSSRWPESYLEILQRIALAVFMSMVVTMAVLFVVDEPDLPRRFILVSFLFLFLLLAVFRGGVNLHLGWRRNGDRFCRHVLVVGSGRRTDFVCKELSVQRSLGHKIVGFLAIDDRKVHCVYGYPFLGVMSDLEAVLTNHSVDEVLFVPDKEDPQDIAPFLTICETMGKDYILVPYMFDPSSDKPLRADTIQSIPVLIKHMTTPNPSGMLYKWIMDYSLGFLGFLILLAIFPFVAVAIKLDSPGPVLFRQPRAGKNGRVFSMYKFRSMAVDLNAPPTRFDTKNEMNGPIFKLKKDPRITRVGWFLRRTSLDEFPQFINVLRGDMSLVGPRPPTQEEVARYRLDHFRRLSFLPGITGLWQVSGRSRIKDFEDIVKLDLEYIDGWRFMRDVKIILKTVWVVLQGDGAY